MNAKEILKPRAWNLDIGVLVTFLFWLLDYKLHALSIGLINLLLISPLSLIWVILYPLRFLGIRLYAESSVFVLLTFLFVFIFWYLVLSVVFNGIFKRKDKSYVVALFSVSVGLLAPTKAKLLGSIAVALLSIVFLLLYPIRTDVPRNTSSLLFLKSALVIIPGSIVYSVICCYSIFLAKSRKI